MASDLIRREALKKKLSTLTITINGLRTGKEILQEAITGYGIAILRIVAEVPAVDAVEVVRCFECVKRGNSIECPMCHDEAYEDDGGYNEWYTYDNTDDDGFCNKGVKKDATD